MRKFLPILIAGVLLLGMQQAQAFDPLDLKRLKETKKCNDCNLSGVNLTNANLKGANFKGANLRGAKFQRANLMGAKLDPEGVKIAKATGAFYVPEPVVVAKKTPKVKPKEVKPNVSPSTICLTRPTSTYFSAKGTKSTYR